MEICVYRSCLSVLREQHLQGCVGSRMGLREKLYSDMVAIEASADLTGSSGNFSNVLCGGQGAEPLYPHFEQSLHENSLCIILAAPFGVQYFLERCYSSVGYQLAT